MGLTSGAIVRTERHDVSELLTTQYVLSKSLLAIINTTITDQ